MYTEHIHICIQRVFPIIRALRISLLSLMMQNKSKDENYSIQKDQYSDKQYLFNVTFYKVSRLSTFFLNELAFSIT